jgi:release factor glutamine methyltransferase
MTPGQLLREAERCLEASGCQDAKTDAWYLYEYVFSADRAQFLMHQADPFTPEADEKITAFRNLVGRRETGEPLQYITGETWFMGLRFEVNPSVLVPRADTEILVETALEQLREGENVLDMCTGSGCILLSIAKLGNPGRTTGADISHEALQTARKNAEHLELHETEFIQSNLFEQIRGRYDMIVSNPPYIPSGEIPHLMREVSLHEPHTALDGGNDGLDFYREITRQSADYLTPGGRLLMEIGADQGEAVCEMMRQAGFEKVGIRKDLAGKDRVVYGRLPE